MLGLLSDSPKFGLQLQQEFEAGTGNVWPLNVGQVYTTLQRLERDGLIESEDGEAKGLQKGYKLTSTGRSELTDWLQTPAGLEPPPRDELVIKVLVASRIPHINIHELLQIHRRYFVEMMQHYTHLKSEAPENDVGFALVIDAQIFRLEGIIRWLNAADVRLKQFAPANADRDHVVEVQ